MKRNNKKHGLTLIEILISLAILSIILIPISNMVIASVKLNTSGEDKQKAVTIAEQLVEEAKALPQLSSSTILSNGLSLSIPAGKMDEYTGTKDLTGGYTETVYIKPKDNLTVDTGIQNNMTYDAEIYIQGTDSNLQFQLKGVSTLFTVGKDNLSINNSSSGITFMVEGVQKGDIIPRTAGSDGKIRVLFKQGLNITGIFNVKAENSLSNPLSIYFENEDTTSVNYTLTNNGGQIRKYNNVSQSAQLTNKSRAYEIQVVITKNSKEIYRTKAYKTMF